MEYDVRYVQGLDHDLDALPEAEALLWVEVIDLIYESDEVRSELTRARGYRSVQPRFDTVPIGELLHIGYNISRIKLYRNDRIQCLPHRLLYALDHKLGRGTIWLLGLMPRSHGYQLASYIVSRVVADYDRQAIAKIPSF